VAVGVPRQPDRLAPRGSWLSSHDVLWAVAIFDLIVWLAFVAMTWRRLYPRLTDDEVATIRNSQMWFVALAGIGLLMSHVPAAQAAGRTDRLFLIYGAHVVIYVGLAINCRFPLSQLPTRTHQWIFGMGMTSLLVTLYAA
jgi:hypothetical protein